MICRICGSKDLTKFLDLGFTPPADSFLSAEALSEPEVWYPLEVFICNNCSLIQLGYIVSPEILFQRDYPYASSMTKTAQEHFFSLAKSVFDRFGLSSSDLVVDIGSNIGVLLQGFKNAGSRVLGIEPASNICEIARKNGIETVNDFFNEKLARRIVKSKKKAKVITGTNVVAHIHDLHSLVRALKILLDDKGVFVFEAPYVVDLIENLEYDTIYHEHVFYLSIKPLTTLFGMHDMEVFDVEKVSIHGGSLRYFVSRKNVYSVSNNAQRFLKEEMKKKIYDKNTLAGFAKSVQKNRKELSRLLTSLKRANKRIAGVSAPAKGMTLLNYCKVGPEVLDFLTEKSPLKIGKYTPGNHIPVVPDSELLKQMPDYALLLAWNFADEIMGNLKDYRKAGGKFIIPIPEPRIIE